MVQNKLSIKNDLDRVRTARDCLVRCFASKDEIEILQHMKEISGLMIGRPVSAFAYAVLDRLDIEKYRDNNPDVLDLIKNWHPEEK